MPRTKDLKSVMKKRAARVPSAAADQDKLRLVATVPDAPASRKDKVLIGGFFAPEQHRTLKVLAASGGRTMQGLIDEALRDLCRKYGQNWE
jgi:hypothetical protein